MSIAKPTSPVTADRALTESPSTQLRDVVALVKPKITLMTLIMATGGYLLAPSSGLNWPGLMATLLGTALSVGAANALNMYIERDSDRFMARTQDRPLPAGRMSPAVALAVGWSLYGLSVLVFLTLVNVMTALLSVAAFILYVFVYTPMKRRSPLALPVGAIPGAMPSLMGWAAVTGQVDLAGVMYTAVLFFWQLPHFLAIACYRKEEYARAKIKTTPQVKGEAAARRETVGYTALLVLVSLALVPLGVGSWLYLAVALGLGGWFFWLSLQALKPDPERTWARRFFLASLVYLPAWALGLVVDVVLL